MHPTHSFALGGSRHLAPSPIITEVVGAILDSGTNIHTGCCTGADQHVIATTCRRAPERLSIFTAFSPAQAGGWQYSAFQQVAAAASSGASISYLAGGPLSLPLAARLIRRSCASFAGCSALILFSPGAGSLAVAAIAHSAGIPCLAFSTGTPGKIPGHSGHWDAGRIVAMPCWHWQPAQVKLL
jgi:hypothetical protein